MYVNAEKVGHAIKPLDRPNGGEWNEEPVLSPGAMDRTWRRVAKEPPIAMIGVTEPPTIQNLEIF